MLTLSHHPETTVWLTDVEQKQLSEGLGARGFPVSFREHHTRGARYMPGSLIPEAKVLILVAAGSLAAKSILQELIKDLYKFFRQRLQQQKQVRARVVLILDVECEGRHYHVGIDANDEATLVIGFYRLHAYVKKEPTVESTLVELEMPKFPLTISFYVFLPIATLVWLFPENSKARIFIKPGFTVSLVVSLIWFVFVFGLALILTLLKRRAFRRRFAGDARRWELEIVPLEGAGANSSIDIRFRIDRKIDNSGENRPS